MTGKELFDYLLWVLTIVIIAFALIAVYHREEIKPAKWEISIYTDDAGNTRHLISCPRCVSQWQFETETKLNYCPRCGLRLEGLRK